MKGDLLQNGEMKLYTADEGSDISVVISSNLNSFSPSAFPAQQVWLLPCRGGKVERMEFKPIQEKAELQLQKLEE